MRKTWHRFWNPSMQGPALLAGAVVVLAGCGGGSTDTPDPPPPPPPAAIGQLKQIDDPGELETAIKSGFLQISPAATAVVAEPADAGAFTGTYTQEIDVDEFDTVRYDGEHLFVAPERIAYCCFPTDNISLPASEPQPQRQLRILKTQPTDATATEVGTIALADDQSVQGLYVSGDQLVTLTTTAYYGSFGAFFTDAAIWGPERVGLGIYDIADPAAPQLEIDIEFDGVFVESRRVGDTVYVVSRYSPTVEGIEYYVTTPSQQAANEALLAEATLDDLLPTVTVNGQDGVLIDPTNCYLDRDDAGGVPVLTSITEIDLTNPGALRTTCVNDQMSGVYMSAGSVYLTAALWSEQDGEHTSIHKFALGTEAPQYVGSAEIGGAVWQTGQADFRMSEHDGDLRVMTVTGVNDSADRIDNTLYVLRDDPANRSLDVIGQLPNDARPDEIGKPNETLFGVRFLGDRAFAVTFERIDPLYAIDLTDPQDPRIAGELTVTGFSNFLHPVSDDLLLGVGVADDGGLKVELFDVSVLSQPLSRNVIEFGPNSGSEALTNRHAVAYLPGDGGPDRFTLPISRVNVADGWTSVDSLGLFEISDKATPNLSALTATGELAPPTLESAYTWRSRAYLHDDAMFYVRGDEVWGALWSQPEAHNGPL